MSIRFKAGHLFKDETCIFIMRVDRLSKYSRIECKEDTVIYPQKGVNEEKWAVESHFEKRLKGVSVDFSY